MIDGVSYEGAGITFNDISGVLGFVLSDNAFAPTSVHDNEGGYQVYNKQTFQFSSTPSGGGNIDARNVWWGTTNISEIQSMIYDFFDDASKGIVFIEPFFLGWATNNVPINWLQDHGLSTNASDVVGDQEGDGSSTWQEFFAGTNPTNEHSVFMVSNIVSQSSSNIVLNWLSVSIGNVEPPKWMKRSRLVRARRRFPDLAGSPRSAQVS